MFIQAIPPFKTKRSSATPPQVNVAAPASATPALPAPTRTASSNTNSSSSAIPLSPTGAAAANRLNVNASSFKPIHKVT